MKTRFALWQTAYLIGGTENAPTIEPFLVKGCALNSEGAHFYTSDCLFTGITTYPRWVSSYLLFTDITEAQFELEARARKKCDERITAIGEAAEKARAEVAS